MLDSVYKAELFLEVVFTSEKRVYLCKRCGSDLLNFPEMT